MSEFSKGDLEKMMRDALREELRTKAILEGSAGQREEAATKPTADVILEHLEECPDCFRDVMTHLMEHSESECEDCHGPLGSEKVARQLPECPYCGGKKAVKRER